MADIGKVLFNIQKLEILKAKCNLQTKNVISDAYAYAWSVGVYPLYDNFDYNVDLKEYFTITEEKTSFVLNYLDNEWQNKNYYTFYELEDYFDVLGSGKYSRNDLISILRYAYLHKKFDKTFWDKLFSESDNPCEAESIISPFDPSDLL